MNERTHFFIKMYLSHFILERVDVSVVCERWVERHIYSERGLLLTISSNECPAYDTKQSDGEVPVMLELWGIRSISSLPSLPGPLWPGDPKGIANGMTRAYHLTKVLFW